MPDRAGKTDSCEASARHVRRAPGVHRWRVRVERRSAGHSSAPIALMPASFSPSLLSANKPPAVRVQRQGLDEQCDQCGRAELQPGVRRAQQTTVARVQRVVQRERQRAGVKH